MKEEQLYEELFKNDSKSIDYKAIVADYLLRWPFIVGFLVCL